MTPKRNFIFLAYAAVLMLAAIVPSASAAKKPVKVYILSGQSNMVGIGQVRKHLTETSLCQAT